MQNVSENFIELIKELKSKNIPVISIDKLDISGESLGKGGFG